jgi:hypothetical protein
MNCIDQSGYRKVRRALQYLRSRVQPAMALNFPNGSRSFDARRDLIRFWGYDSALEISFFVEMSALY